MKKRVTYLIASCLTLGLPMESHSTPSSSANYLAGSPTKQFHDYIFEQSTKVLMPTWAIHYTDNRIRSFPVRYKTFKYEPRWSEIYNDFGVRFGVAVLADMRNQTLVLTWADEFKKPGLHYVQSKVRHERERYGWDAMLATAMSAQVAYEHQKKLDAQQAEFAREQKYNSELYAHKERLTKQAEIKERQRDQALFQSVRNLESDYELRRARLESSYAMKRLELKELKEIQTAHYKMDRDELTEKFEQLVSQQNSKFAQEMIDLQVQYDLDTQLLNQERQNIARIQSKLEQATAEYEKQLRNATISKNKFNAELAKIENESRQLEAAKKTLAQRKQNLEALHAKRQASLDSEIAARTKALNSEVVAMKNDLDTFKADYKESIDKELYAKNQALEAQKESLVKREAELFSLKNKYYPDYAREISSGPVEPLLTQFLQENWKYTLDWNDSLLPSVTRGQLRFNHSIKFSGNKLEGDIESIICHIAKLTPGVVFDAQILTRDRVVSIQANTADPFIRKEFIQQCK